MSVEQKRALRIAGGVRRSQPGASVGFPAPDEASGVEDSASGLVFGLLLLILNDTSSAEEVLLQVYEEVRLNAAHFEKSRENVLTWLITITHRQALERLCSSSEDQRFAVSVGLASAPGGRQPRSFGISKSAHRRLVAASLDRLSPAERKMIELAYFSRMSTLEIALKLRQSPDAVKAGLQHGISQLYILFTNRESLVGSRTAEQVSGNAG